MSLRLSMEDRRLVQSEIKEELRDEEAFRASSRCCRCA